MIGKIGLCDEINLLLSALSSNAFENQMFFIRFHSWTIEHTHK